jgi:hypothetical protein
MKMAPHRQGYLIFRQRLEQEASSLKGVSIQSADENSRAECLRRRTVTAQLRFWLSTLLLDMKNNATDRFMRDFIYGCYSAERFFLLYTRCTKADADAHLCALQA